jgi:hypothetical protein
LLRIFRTYIPLPYKNRFLEKEKSMRNVILISTFIVLLVFIESPFCIASSLTINPSDDGSVGSSGSVDNSSYLMCTSGGRGIVEFPLAAVSEPISSAELSVNPYALPLWNPTIHVYGYASTDGVLTSSDYSAGTFLGDWALPSLTFGQDAYFDVSAFLKTVSTPYVGFNLRVDSFSPNTFSSLERNYGHPSQLSIVTIPEPATILLLGLGAAILRKKR